MANIPWQRKRCFLRCLLIIKKHGILFWVQQYGVQSGVAGRVFDKAAGEEYSMKETRISMLSLQMSICGMALTSVGLVTPRLAEMLGLAAGERGMLVSMQYLGATLACLVSGILCVKYGSAFITRVLLAGAAVVMLAFGLTQNYPMALVGIFLLGGVSLGLENSIMSSGLNLGERSHVANSLIQVSFSVGAIVVPLLFLLFSRWNMWRPVYYTLAVFLVVAFVFARGTKEKEGAGVSFTGMLKTYLTYFTKPASLIGAVAVFLYVAAEVGLWSMTPTLFESTGGGQLSGIISSVFIWVMMLAGRLLSTLLMKKLSLFQIMVPFGVLGLVSYSMLLLTSGTVAIVFAALSGLACAPFYALLTSWATMVAKDNSSSYIAFIMAFGTAGPVLLGAVVSLLGNTASGNLIILPALCCFALLMALLAAYRIVTGKAKA